MSESEQAAVDAIMNLSADQIAADVADLERHFPVWSPWEYLPFRVRTVISDYRHIIRDMGIEAHVPVFRDLPPEIQSVMALYAMACAPDQPHPDIIRQVFGPWLLARCPYPEQQR